MALGVWKLARPNRHPGRFSGRGPDGARRRRAFAGFHVNRRELTGWSFVMSSAHGAGLMLVPVPVLAGAGVAAQGHHHETAEAGLGHLPLVSAALAVAVHTAAMLLVMGVIVVVVYEKVGLGILRRAWVNLDRVGPAPSWQPACSPSSPD